MLSDRRIVIADPNNYRIVIINGESVSVLVDGNDLNLSPHAVAVLPNDLVCFGTFDGDLWIVDPDTKRRSFYAKLPSRICALGSNSFGELYAATWDRSLFRISSGNVFKQIENIPLSNISDISVSDDNIVYIAGYEKVLQYKLGSLRIIADGLHYEPVWIELDQYGNLLINEISQGLQKYHVDSGILSKVKVDGFYPFGDILSPDYGKIIFYDFEVFYEFDLQTEIAIPLFSVIGNGFSFSVSHDEKAYFETPGKYNVLDQHIISLEKKGSLTHLVDLSYKSIRSKSIDNENRLCLFTNEGFIRVENDGKVTKIADKIDLDIFSELREFSISKDGFWYFITTDFDGYIGVYRFDENDNFEALPIFFDRDSFSGAQISDASIEVCSDGNLAIIVTAIVSKTHGPFYQRVYRANSDGSNLRLVANLDSNRTGGMVDIACGNNKEIFALTVQGSTGDPDIIYRIDANNTIYSFVVVEAGNDPKSIDTGPNGSLWFSTTQGIFRAYPR